MTLDALTQYLETHYGTTAESPWARFPDYAVFRHAHNRKWFCLIGRVAARALGLPGDGSREFVNVKAAPDMVGALRLLPGILPAYHMNKEHWLTLLPDELPDGELISLIDESFERTQ